ncbi:MAG: hypothetical protein M1817_002704 [Caeruleum heppii]|nr:MAG: hypothetical protein M1817_002704 [Caeruleum heppii]
MAKVIEISDDTTLPPPISRRYSTTERRERRQRPSEELRRRRTTDHPDKDRTKNDDVRRSVRHRTVRKAPSSVTRVSTRPAKSTVSRRVSEKKRRPKAAVSPSYGAKISQPAGVEVVTVEVGAEDSMMSGGRQGSRRSSERARDGKRRYEARQTVTLTRSSSMREPTTARERPPLRRSTTTRSRTTATRPSSHAIPTVTVIPEQHHGPAESIAHSKRSSGFLARFFPTAPSTQRPAKAERRVECLTCLSDDIPISKSAKLGCGHIMCTDCLIRIFKLSVTDPQHMPPKCCTPDHIPLKHVDRLFDNKFKARWNRKFQEYTTKNRLYCPKRGCGNWIKPSHIHHDRSVASKSARTYGKCSRCKTKVCCKCNNKWHSGKDCPKDEATKQFVEIAKREGWQRCHNCSAMVELKEGCNHMTCRCTAEFCMLCGAKWKTCNCPWFNYDQIEMDRLDHMNFAMPAYRVVRHPAPPRYDDEMAARRRQHDEDEHLARRFQQQDLGEGAGNGIGGVFNVGNVQEHFLNQDYIRVAAQILGGAFDQATAAADRAMGGGARTRGGQHQAGERRDRQPGAAGVGIPLRQHSSASRRNRDTPGRRTSERVVPRRSSTDYATEALRHAPADQSTDARPVRRPSQGNRRHSMMAGLGRGTGTTRGRVGAWLQYVEVGRRPEEPKLDEISIAG